MYEFDPECHSEIRNEIKVPAFNTEITVSIRKAAFHEKYIDV